MLVFVSRAVKGPCLAGARFWQKILSKGLEIFCQTCMTLHPRKEHGNTFALRMKTKAYRLLHQNRWEANGDKQIKQIRITYNVLLTLNTQLQTTSYRQTLAGKASITKLFQV